MNGKEWVKANRASEDEEVRLIELAESASCEIVGKSRIARKAREYIAARDAFESQLSKNGIDVG